MPYFKHSELVDTYHVSLKTVHNWIDGAKQGKIDLDLFERNGRTYIANQSRNLLALQKLSEQGKKYRNVRYNKPVTPLDDFYQIYNRQQIHDIITNLETHGEIPRQYNYFNGGANNWDKFARQMEKGESPNMLKGGIELIRANLGNIDALIEGYDQVNIIDIGPGNCVPVKELLTHLIDKKVLHRYIAIDISESMLQIARKNITTWFSEDVEFEGYIKDVTRERFDDLLIDDMLVKGGTKTINLALLMGATPMNYPDPYEMVRVICKSLGSNDLLMYTDKPHTAIDQVNFEVNANLDSNASALSPKYSFIIDLLGIDGSLYDVEMGFNEKVRISYIQVRLKTAVTILFDFTDGQRSVNLEKGQTILLWRAWYQTQLEIISEFEHAGLTLLQSSLTKDRQYMLTISGVDTKAGLKY